MMTISSPKKGDRQLFLWDRPLGNHGTRRNVIGNIVEEMAAAMFGGVRHKTDSRCEYCPDVSIPLGPQTSIRGVGCLHPRLYLECKAAGRSRQTFIYEGRLEKDRRFAKDHPLFYAVFHHWTDTKLADTIEGLEALFLANMRCVYLVPFAFIDKLTRGMDAERLNSNYGGTDRKTYGSGFRIKLKDLEPWELMTWQ